MERSTAHRLSAGKSLPGRGFRHSGQPSIPRQALQVTEVTLLALCLNRAAFGGLIYTPEAQSPICDMMTRKYHMLFLPPPSGL